MREVWVDGDYFPMMRMAEEDKELASGSLGHARLDIRSIVLDKDGHPHVVQFFPPKEKPKPDPPPKPRPPASSGSRPPLLSRLQTIRFGVYHGERV